MLKAFKEFVMRGNVLDLAVGVIIGAAFGKIVASLVDDILMPPAKSGKPRLTDAEITTLRAWIEQGAEWPDSLANEIELPPLDPKAIGPVSLTAPTKVSGGKVSSIRPISLAFWADSISPVSIINDAHWRPTVLTI